MEKVEFTSQETQYLSDMMEDRGIDCDDIDTIIKVLKERSEELRYSASNRDNIVHILLNKMLDIKAGKIMGFEEEKAKDWKFEEVPFSFKEYIEHVSEEVFDRKFKEYIDKMMKEKE